MQLNDLRFADDIALITSNIGQAAQMLVEFDETHVCIGLQLNLQKTMFMRDGWVSDVPFTLNRTNISEPATMHQLRLYRSGINMKNDLTRNWAGANERLGERIRALEMK